MRNSIVQNILVIFQFTTSQGGRLLWLVQSGLAHILSIHDLTRRSTSVTLMLACSIWAFQFTTSQGGRRQAASIIITQAVFQFTTSQGGRRMQ